MTMLTPSDIGKALRDRRKLLRLTIAQVAELSSCSMPSVHAAETGKPTLRLHILLAIANTLGLEFNLTEHRKERFALAAEEAVTYDEPESGDDGDA